MRLSKVKPTGLMAVAALAWVGFAATAQDGGATPHPRGEIALFKYHGALPNQPGAAQFDVFQGLIDQKIDRLRNQLESASVTKASPGLVPDVHLKYRGEDSFEEASGVALWLKNEGSVLNVMRGTIVADQDANYSVHTRFYLADRTDYLPLDVVSVQLPIKDTEFANTADSHTLVILYALAMDAKRLKRPPAQVAVFLSAAENTIADLEGRSGKLTGDLASLKAAVKKAKADILTDHHEH